MSGSTVVKMTSTAADGSYTLTSVSPGSYTLMAVKSGLGFNCSNPLYNSSQATCVANGGTWTPDPLANVTNANLTGINIKANR
jgi:hypothetical protein